MASLIWTRSSKQDLKDIYSYISCDSKYYAAAFVNKINQAAKKLKKFPALGRIVPEYRNENIREILFQNYRVIYRHEKDFVTILTIFHANRDLTNYKLEDWEII